MAFTDTTSAPKIYDDYDVASQPYTFIPISTGLAPVTYYRTIRTTKWRHLCLTRAAADSIADYLNDTHTQASAQRMNSANMYMVRVTHDTEVTGWDT